MLAWNCRGFTADKGEALLLALSSRMLRAAAVMPVESHQFLARDVLGGFVVLESMYNVGFWRASRSGEVHGHRFGGLALAVDPR